MGNWENLDKSPFGVNSHKSARGLGLLYCAYFRPHQGLNGATPAEIYFGRKPAQSLATSLPRGWPGAGSSSPPFKIAYLDPEGLLPVLFPKAA